MALLAVLAISAAACGGDDDDDDASASGSDTSGESSGGGHDRDDYVDALSGNTAQEGFTEEEADCASGVIVDLVGVEELEAVGAWDKIQANSTGSLSDFGVELDEEQKGALFEGVNGCFDLRAFFQENMAAGGALSPELAQCVMDEVDDATFEQIMVVVLTEGQTGLDAQPELTAVFEQAGADCAAAGVS
jgi:hypothetical protein